MNPILIADNPIKILVRSCSLKSLLVDPKPSIQSKPLRLAVAIFCLLISSITIAGTVVDINIEASTEYEGKRVTLHSELHKPEGNGPFPAVVLMHGCAGMQSSVQQSMRTHAKFFVSNGFVAIILDSFGSRNNGDGWVCERLDRLMSARIYRTTDAIDALKYLQSLEFIDDGNIFQMGQSNGGSVAIRLAQLNKPVFKASVGYYPWCGSFNRLGSKAEFTSPLLVLSGTADDWTPVTDCQNLQSTRAEYKVIAYPGAQHSFDLEIPLQKFQGHSVGYDRKATIDSRKQMAAFFYRYLSDDLKATLPDLTLAETPKSTYLSGLEIKQLMPSGELKGINGYGNPYTITYAKSGDMSGVAGKSDEYKDTGKWWVEDNKFCRQYKSWLDGVATCFQISLENSVIGFFDEGDELVSSGSFNVTEIVMTEVISTNSEYLKGHEIQQLMPTGKLKGVNDFGNPFTIAYSDDGVMSGVAGKSDEYKDTGKWWVENNKLCRQYETWLKGNVTFFQIKKKGSELSFFDADGGLVSLDSFE